MGGPSDSTERRRSRTAYVAAAARLTSAMARVRELVPPLDLPAGNRMQVEPWTAEQMEAMEVAAAAWSSLVGRRKELEAAHHTGQRRP